MPRDRRPAGHADDRRGRVVRADVDDRDAGREPASRRPRRGAGDRGSPGLRESAGRSSAAARARSIRSVAQSRVGRRAARSSTRSSPRRRPRRSASSRPGPGSAAAGRPGAKAGRAALGGQLVDRVERQELQRRSRAYSRSGGTTAWTSAHGRRPCARRDSGTARRARRRRVEQPVVDRPRVDPDRRRGHRRSRGPRRAARSRISPYDRRDVPVQAVGQATGSFGKRWTSVELDASSGPTRPTMTRPLDAPRSMAASEPRGHRRKAAATPASTGMCSPVVWLRSPPVRAKTAAATCSGRTSCLSSVRCA